MPGANLLWSRSSLSSRTPPRNLEEALRGERMPSLWLRWFKITHQQIYSSWIWRYISPETSEYLSTAQCTNSKDSRHWDYLKMGKRIINSQRMRRYLPETILKINLPFVLPDCDNLKLQQHRPTTCYAHVAPYWPSAQHQTILVFAYSALCDGLKGLPGELWKFITHNLQRSKSNWVTRPNV